MSSTLASLLILALALTGAFAWYERTRPPAKLLSLVAALAALAVVGRLAFAAFPNVKPTTDIVLFAGHALGAAPGFAVGAITAVVSNVFLTQGPWTPWQMASWGLVGVMGAVLASATGGRELSRFALALVCGIAGFVFGAIMDMYQWTLAAEQSLDSYLAIAATSLPYNAAHAVGNVVFCLAIGPAFVRALRRYRRRFEVRWAPRAVPVAAALLLVLSVGTAAAASPAADKAVRYLSSTQNADGGFGGAKGQRSTQLHTGWAALGIAASGKNPRDVRRSRRSSIDYMRAGARDLRDVGEIERTILALRAAGLSPRSFGGRNLVRELARFRRRGGSVMRNTAWTAFGIFAWRAAGLERGSREVSTAASWLLRQQNSDGGWGLGDGTPSDVDDTGAVLQALAAAGRGGGTRVERAVRYLRRAQNPDGGFGQMAERSSNAQSTAWAVQGLLAAGRRPEALRRGGRNPISYLASLQAADGSVRYSRTSRQTPVWVTAQAATALARKTFPLAPVARQSSVVSRQSSVTTVDAEPRPSARKSTARDDEPAEPAARTVAATTVAAQAAQAPAAAPAQAADDDAGGGSPLVPLLVGLAAVAGIAWMLRPQPGG